MKHNFFIVIEFCVFCRPDIGIYSAYLTIKEFETVRKRASLIIFRLQVTQRVKWRQLWVTDHTVISEYIFWGALIS